MVDRRGWGRGEGDPRETTECKQVVEEEVRRGEGTLVLFGFPLRKRLCRLASIDKAAEQEGKNLGSIHLQNTTQVHQKYRKASGIAAKSLLVNKVET